MVLLKRLIFLTNCSDAALTSSSVTGGSKLKSVLMFRHISFTSGSWQTPRRHAPAIRCLTRFHHGARLSLLFLKSRHAPARRWDRTLLDFRGRWLLSTISFLPLIKFPISGLHLPTLGAGTMPGSYGAGPGPHRPNTPLSSNGNPHASPVSERMFLLTSPPQGQGGTSGGFCLSAFTSALTPSLFKDGTAFVLVVRVLARPPTAFRRRRERFSCTSKRCSIFPSW